MHIERIYLPESRYDEFRGAFVAKARRSTSALLRLRSEMGSLVSVDHMRASSRT